MIIIALSSLALSTVKNLSTAHHRVAIMVNPDQEKFAVKYAANLREAVGELIAYNLLERLGVKVPERRFIAQDGSNYCLITSFTGSDIKECLSRSCVVKDQYSFLHEGTLFDAAFGQIQAGCISDDSHVFKQIIGLREHVMAFVMTGDGAILSPSLDNGRLIPSKDGYLFCKIDPYNDTDIFGPDSSFADLMDDLEYGRLREKEDSFYSRGRGFGSIINRGCYTLFPFTVLSNEIVLASAKKVAGLTDTDIADLVQAAFPLNFNQVKNCSETKDELATGATRELIRRRNLVQQYIHKKTSQLGSTTNPKVSSEASSSDMRSITNEQHLPLRSTLFAPPPAAEQGLKISENANVFPTYYGMI